MKMTCVSIRLYKNGHAEVKFREHMSAADVDAKHEASIVNLRMPVEHAREYEIGREYTIGVSV